MTSSKIIYTIGHSTRSIDNFIEILQSFEIKLLADIRLLPGSNRFPHFNQDQLKVSLSAAGIDYHHFKDLGGRRRPAKDSHNVAWRNAAFRGYADYMETIAFREAVTQLESLALKTLTAYMCAEAVWYSCHRALLSDYLKIAGWTVLHISNRSRATAHPYTKAATINNGKLDYTGTHGQQDLF